MSKAFLHDLLNLTTAVTLHLHEAKDCYGVRDQAVATEHIEEALAITRRIDAFIRKVKTTK